MQTGAAKMLNCHLPPTGLKGEGKYYLQVLLDISLIGFPAKSHVGLDLHRSFVRNTSVRIVFNEYVTLSDPGVI